MRYTSGNGNCNDKILVLRFFHLRTVGTNL